ncbi:MAG: o-succinylbenzoate synthase [Eggerthellaceae bacterium]|nr:o-succinylbenzoate synthase [Eggerthellaceae bacterium]
MIEDGILDVIERAYTFDPDGVCFYIASVPGLPGKPAYESVTYSQLRTRAARLARAIDRMEVHRGMWCVADMDNCSSFVYLLVAAAMGGFSVVALNTRLTALEKAERLEQVHASLCVESLPVFDEQSVKEAIRDDMAFDRIEKMEVPRWMRRGMGSFSWDADAVAMFTSGTTGRPKAAPLTWGNVLGAAEASNAVLNISGQGLWQLALPMYHVGGMEIVMRSIMNGNPFILYRKFDAAQLLRDVDAYGATHVSVVDKMLLDMLNVDEAMARRMRPGGVFPAEQIEDEAFDPEEGASDPVGLQGVDPDELVADPDDPFAAMDPFEDEEDEPAAGGARKQSHARSEANREQADASERKPAEEAKPEEDCVSGAAANGAINTTSTALGESAGTLAASAVSASSATSKFPWVPDPIDDVDPFEAEDEAQAPAKNARPLARYQAILLGGAAPNTATLRRALVADARVFASYGMTETCSQVASRLVTDEYDGTLTPLPGYKMAVVAPDEEGFGQLAVKGPGVMSDYLNARGRFTADGYFLTGDRAKMQGRCICVAERTEDMFVSGGENIYPEEIRAKLLLVPGVTDAYVFGDEDAEWGRRPVAVVEAADSSQDPDFNLQLMTDDIRLSLANRLSRLYQPDSLIVVPEFPRSGIGKTDRHALRRLYEQRIDVRKVEIWRAKQPFNAPLQTAKAKLRERETLVVRVTDWAGRTGIGEDVAFSASWYLPETISQGLEVLQDVLVPIVNDYVFVHPSQASVLFRTVDQARECPMACAALESALWDLYGKVMSRSVTRLIGGRDCVTEAGSLRATPPGCVPCSAVVGVANRRETLEQVHALVDAGHECVRLKVSPGQQVATAEAVHEAFPKLTLVLEANQSFTENDLDALRRLDALNAACIEDPLDSAFQPKVGPKDFWTRLVRLQRDLSTPICLDESWTSSDELKRALELNPTLRCVVLRLGKFGGVQPTLEFYWWARERGISMLVGGMLGMGISARLNAALTTLPGMNVPGDIGDASRHFATSITAPPLSLHRGMLRVNPKGYEYGLGCDLDESALAEVAVEHITLG